MAFDYENYNGLTRRQVNLGVASALAAFAIPGCSTISGSAAWLSADDIIAQTQPPNIPNARFEIDDFGAVPDGVFDCSEAIHQAIAHAVSQGGGTIVFTPGVYVTGPIRLKSKVALHLEDDATLRFVTDPSRYLPAVFTRWEGMELMGFSPLIYAYGLKDVAITGHGTLDGGANNQTWWPWKGPHKEAHWDLIEGQDQKPARDALFAMAERGVPPRERVFADGGYLRPPFLQFYDCQRVLVEGVTIKNAPFWLVHPVLSRDVTIRGVHCQSYGPNSDGCDPESCERVVIEDCVFDTGDDCIALKSGRNADGRRIGVPCKDVVVQNCHMKEGHGGVVIGSEISGGVANVHVRNCTMDSPHLERAIRIKTNAQRGGLIEHLRYSNITIGSVKDVFVINFYYEEGDRGNWMPLVRDIEISYLSVAKAERIFNLRGFPQSPITGVSLRNWNVVEYADFGVIEDAKLFSAKRVVLAGKSIDSGKALLSKDAHE